MSILKKHKTVLFLLLVVSSNELLHGIWGASVSQEESTCRFNGLGGRQPQRACSIRDFLKVVRETKKKNRNDDSSNTNEKPQELFHNAWIFFGARGLGKTSITALLAKEADACLEFNSSDDLANEIAETGNVHKVLADVFKRAKNKAIKNRKPTVIVLDEIDTFTAQHTDIAEATFGALRNQLDKHKNDPDIMVIVTSNTLEKLNSPFLNRCIQVEWKKPSENDRESIIIFYKNRNGIKLSETFIKKIAKKTTDFAGRDLELAFVHAKMEANDQLSKEVKEIHVQRGIEKRQQEIDSEKETWGAWYKRQVYDNKEVIGTVGTIAGVIIYVITGRTPSPPKSS